jgi:hypothetical protein
MFVAPNSPLFDEPRQGRHVLMLRSYGALLSWNSPAINILLLRSSEQNKDQERF